MEKSLESVTMAVQLLLVQLTKASRYDVTGMTHQRGLSHGCLVHFVNINDWNLESQIPLIKNPKSRTWSPESTARNPQSKSVLDYYTRELKQQRF